MSTVTMEEEDNTVTVATYNGQNLEELIGTIQEEYPCSYSGVNGTLYAADEGLAFLGKFFLFDKKILLKWVDVQVQQSDQVVFVQTREEQPVLHYFHGIQKPEKCWQALVSMHNQALLDITRSPSGGTMPVGIEIGHDERGSAVLAPPSSTRSITAQPIRRKTMRRMTSDPSKLAPAIEALFSEENKHEIFIEGTQTTAPQTTTAVAATTTLAQEAAAGEGAAKVGGKVQRRSSVLEKGKLLLEQTASIRSTSEALGVVEIDPLSELEAIVGKVQGQFPCFYGKQRGTLHAGSTALYFEGGRMFFASRLTIRSSNIRQIKMIKGKPRSDLGLSEPTADDIISEQGIVVWTRDGISHTFLGMEYPDKVWASLVALRNHAGTESSRPFAMRRMNSDPNLTAQSTGNDLVAYELDHKDTEAKDAVPKKPELTVPVLTDEEVEKAWSEVMSKKNRYQTCVVKDHEFSCSLDTFFNSYIGDEAEFNLSNFMESIGDKDFKTTPWKPTRKDGKIVRSRIIRYVHPINAPMAPPEAKARKEQSYHRFGDYGIVVETKTFVDDVPMTDCFYVKDRIIVASSKEDKGTVLVTLEFELEFVKSTMFRRIITSTTTAEMTKFFQSLKVFMADSVAKSMVGGEPPSKPKKATEEVEKEVTEESVSLLPIVLAMNKATHGLLAGVIVMQVWILLEMYSMKRAIFRMEHTEYNQAFFGR